MNDLKPLRDAAEVAKLRGMELAAAAKLDQVSVGKIALLRALLSSPDGTATIDDATGDLAEEFRDGGKWRGNVCRSLAMARITESVEAVKSDRPSRHRGYVTRWRLVDRRKASLMLAGLVAAMDSRLLTADALAKSEAPTGTTVEASAQKTFPQFAEKKGFSNGKTL